MISGLVTWGATISRLSANEEADKDTKDRVTQVERDLGTIKATLASLDTSQRFTAAELERLRTEQARLNQQLTELLRELRAR